MREERAIFNKRGKKKEEREIKSCSSLLTTNMDHYIKVKAIVIHIELSCFSSLCMTLHFFCILRVLTFHPIIKFYMVYFSLDCPIKEGIFLVFGNVLLIY